MPALRALIPSEGWQALLAAGTTRHFETGEVLLRQGDPGSHVLVLTAGYVKVVRLEPDGNTLLLAVRGPGELLGELAVLDGTVRSATTIALRPSLTFVLPKTAFERVIDRFGLENVLLRHLLARYREGEEIRGQLANLPAGDRVVRMLVRLAEALPEPGAGQSVLDLGLSQEELGRAVGLSRSAIAAELARLRGDGLVVTSRRRIAIRDLVALRRLAGASGDARAD